jgi:leucyl-tRNA synthetase
VPWLQTVLADEQVLDGACERCGNIVTKKLLEQWFFRITAYAEKLLGNIVGSGKTGVNLDWSEKVKVAQRNWIGKKEGINITYSVVDEKGSVVGEIMLYHTSGYEFWSDVCRYGTRASLCQSDHGSDRKKEARHNGQISHKTKK